MSDAQTAGLALPVVPGHGSHGLPPTVPGALPTGPLPGQHRPAHGSPQRRCVYIHNYSPTHYVTLNDGRRKSKQKGKLGQIHTRTRSWRKSGVPRAHGNVDRKHTHTRYCTGPAAAAYGDDALDSREEEEEFFCCCCGRAEYIVSGISCFFVESETTTKKGMRTRFVVKCAGK